MREYPYFGMSREKVALFFNDLRIVATIYTVFASILCTAIISAVLLREDGFGMIKRAS